MAADDATWHELNRERKRVRPGRARRVPPPVCDLADCDCQYERLLTPHGWVNWWIRPSDRALEQLAHDLELDQLDGHMTHGLDRQLKEGSLERRGGSL